MTTAECAVLLGRVCYRGHTDSCCGTAGLRETASSSQHPHAVRASRAVEVGEHGSRIRSRTLVGPERPVLSEYLFGDVWRGGGRDILSNIGDVENPLIAWVHQVRG